MNKWLLATGLSLIITTTTFSQAVERIAVINVGDVFQQIAKRNKVSVALEKEFKSRANELQRIEGDLQNKMQRLQRDGATMQSAERSKLEKDVMIQRQTFSQKAQSFEQDRQRRSNEERSKLLMCIQEIVKNIADHDNIDIVMDTSAIAFSGKTVRDITSDVLKQAK